MSLIIIDGVSASGKSLALKAIQKLIFEERTNYSKIILSEHLTERYFENKKPTYELVNSHLINILKIITDIISIQKNSRFESNNQVLSFFIERLFLTFISRGFLSKIFFDENKILIQNLNIHHILLIIPDNLFEDRLKSTLEMRNELWANYIESLGGLKKAIDYFKIQQDKMINGCDILSHFMEVSLFEVPDVNNIPIDQFFI